MPIADWLPNAFLWCCDHAFALWPRPRPSAEQLRRCKIVSHRGEHDNRTVFENTLAAFDRVRAAGVWGIELDVRWTRDLQPVVFHDPDCRRLFGSPLALNRLTLEELQARFPLIPTLEQVVARHGKQLHLMIEVKEERYPDPAWQNRRLGQVLAPLTPCRDYHLLSLAPAMFALLDCVPRDALLAVCTVNVGSWSAAVEQNRYGGVTGHYWLLGDGTLTKHRRLRQKGGTGFVYSRNSLYREVNRGVDWVFSNHALKLQAICDADF